jgi:hypothetical protein
VGKKIKNEALGSRIGKKSAVELICRSDVSMFFRQLNSYSVILYIFQELDNIRK